MKGATCEVVLAVMVAGGLASACTSGDHSERQVMVPTGSTSVLIRSSASSANPARPRHTRDLLTAGYAALVGEINAGIGKPFHRSCNGGGLSRSYTLEFRYPSRPSVTVTIEPDCHPSIHNGHGLDTDNIGQVLPTLRHLIGLRPGFS